MYLAVRGQHLATIEEISQAYGISKGHLMKVVHELGRAGFVETTRGRGGGTRSDPLLWSLHAGAGWLVAVCCWSEPAISARQFGRRRVCMRSPPERWEPRSWAW